jgi:hypothetical protein
MQLPPARAPPRLTALQHFSMLAYFKEEMQMEEQQRRARELDALELKAAELEGLRVLKEHELGVRLEYDPDAGGPYVTNAEK